MHPLPPTSCNPIAVKVLICSGNFWYQKDLMLTIFSELGNN